MPTKIYGKLALLCLTMLALITVTGTSARAERRNPLVKLETSLGEITLELSRIRPRPRWPIFCNMSGKAFITGPSSTGSSTVSWSRGAASTPT